MAKDKKKAGMKMRNKRLLVALAFLVLVAISLVAQTGTGTASAFGIGSVSALCPLGALEAAIASRTIVPAGVIGLAIVVVIVLITGRGFCAWLCPTQLVRRLFGLKTPAEREQAQLLKQAKTQAKAEGGDVDEIYARLLSESLDAHQQQVAKRDAGQTETVTGLAKLKVRDDDPDPERGGVADSRNWVLGGALITTAVFGFPVFCLICPVGLTFASFIVIWRAFQLGETTLSLLVFPALLILELVVFRKWCHTLCPMAALMSLISRGNKTFKATINPDTCLKDSKGVECNRCSQACPEGIDLHKGALTTPHYECIKCGECKAVCPVAAISFPFFPKKADAPEEVAEKVE